MSHPPQLRPVFVSIHASAREATKLRSDSDRGPEFQSTPPRGRRPSVAARATRFDSFNPRLRAGGDGRG